MADGIFRRLIRDEEIRREEYLDRQLEIGWEETPADQALESPERLGVDRLLEREEPGAPSFSRARQRAYARPSGRPSRPSYALRRLPSTASSAARHTGSRS